MQFTTLIISLMASLAMAIPTNTGGGGGGGGEGGGSGGGGGGSGTPAYDPCGTSTLLNAQPQCCSADVGGIADLTCQTVPETPTSAANFKTICAKNGQTAQCCTVSVLGISLLCAVPVGV